jgi:hypothetical protein
VSCDASFFPAAVKTTSSHLTLTRYQVRPELSYRKSEPSYSKPTLPSTIAPKCDAEIFLSKNEFL